MKNLKKNSLKKKKFKIVIMILKVQWRVTKINYVLFVWNNYRMIIKKLMKKLFSRKKLKNLFKIIVINIRFYKQNVIMFFILLVYYNGQIRNKIVHFVRQDLIFFLLIKF